MSWQRGTVPAPAVQLVRLVERERLVPYWDGSARWTIGVGATRDLAGAPVTPQTPPITPEQSGQLLARDLGASAAAVGRMVQVDLEDHEAAALISFDYNLGDGALARSTLLRLLNAGNRDAVPGELRKWIYSAGNPELGLLRRRGAEALVWRGTDPQAAYDTAWSRISALSQWVTT